jgi:hypothetical protein
MRRIGGRCQAPGSQAGRGAPILARRRPARPAGETLRLRRALLILLFALLPLAGRAQSNDPSFRVVNSAGEVINELYASPSGQRAWGPDRLGDRAVPPGGNFIVRLPSDGNCLYDIRVVFRGGAADERRGVNTCNLTDFVVGRPGSGAAAGPRGNPSFNLVNQSARPIAEFYASPTTAQGWGRNRLGEGLVPPGQYMAIRLPAGGCGYDLRWVFQGGGAEERRNVNTCATNNYIVR